VITDADGEEVSEFTVDSLTEDFQITVTNTFDVGSIDVRKRVVGPGPGRYEVQLACVHDVDGTATDVEIPGGATRTLRETDDLRATYVDLPVGAECTLVVSDDGGARATTITPNDGDPEVGVVTVEDGASVELLVENEFDPDLAPVDTPDDDGGGLLPDTGAARGLLALAVIGLLLLGAGVLLVQRARRQRLG
jgi:LPXTG-motif cell wall-anchored protein